MKKFFLMALSLMFLGTVNAKVTGTDDEAKTPDGVEAVDLGLSVKWANVNVGATKDSGFGSYFAWGETKPKEYYSWNTYVWSRGNTQFLTKYSTTDRRAQLTLSDDAARANLGGEWRMPTYSEIAELVDARYTKSEWTTVNGVYGQRVTSIVKGFEDKSIFLPAAGRYRPTLKDEGERGDYWGSELVTDEDSNSSSDYARFFTVNSSRVSKGSSSRSYGCSIRPVVSLDAIVK